MDRTPRSSVESIQSTGSMFADQPADKVAIDTQTAQSVSELKAFARECAAGVAVELGSAEGNRRAVFSIDQSLRTARIAELTFELKSASFSQPPAPTRWQRMFGGASPTPELVTVAGVNLATETWQAAELFFPSDAAAGRFCRLANAIVSMVQKKMGSPKRRTSYTFDGHRTVPMTPSELLPQDGIELNDPESPQKTSVCCAVSKEAYLEEAVIDSEAGCFSLCDASRSAPLSDNRVSNRPILAHNAQFGIGSPQKPPPRNPAFSDENIFS